MASAGMGIVNCELKTENCKLTRASKGAAELVLTLLVQLPVIAAMKLSE